MKINMALLGLCCCANAMAESDLNQKAGIPTPSQTWLVLDDLAYYIYEDVTIDFDLKEVYALNNDVINCSQFNNDPPLDTGQFTLMTDTQDIGLVGEIDYDLGKKAIILTSQTDDLICEGAFEFDRIYIDDFD